MRDIWPRVADVSIHFAHDPDMLVAIQEGIFLVPYVAWPSTM